MILSFDFELYQFCKFEIGSFFKHNQDVVDILEENLLWNTTLMGYLLEISSPPGHGVKPNLCIGLLVLDIKEVMLTGSVKFLQVVLIK